MMDEDFTHDEIISQASAFILPSKKAFGDLNQKVVYNLLLVVRFCLLEGKKCIKTLEKLQSRKFFRYR
jgi:hypothetical protein